MQFFDKNEPNEDGLEEVLKRKVRKQLKMKEDEVIRNVERYFQKRGFELHRSWILDKRGEIRRVTWGLE